VATVPVAVDEGGMQVSALRCAGATIAYVTPSHQFPSGVSMPIGRRSELLGWVAEDPLRYIIEDDYDSEFRFDGRPIPSLQGLGGGQVIYLGTFTKSIAPSIRIAYMVLPRTLLVRYHEMFGSYSSTVSRFEQHTLAQFIAEGHFARYLNRARGAYRRRRDVLRCALTQEFGAGQVRFSGLHTGLYCTAQFTLGLAEAQLITRAAEVGVQVTGLSRYYAHPEKAPASTLVLGYSSMDECELCAAAKLLAAAWSTGLH
ncbi:MAG: PLP-dependent aminotransferase family protein, partial [Pygmaiobacter sp.]